MQLYSEASADAVIATSSYVYDGAKDLNFCVLYLYPEFYRNAVFSSFALHTKYTSKRTENQRYFVDDTQKIISNNLASFALYVMYILYTLW